MMRITLLVLSLSLLSACVQLPAFSPTRIADPVSVSVHVYAYQTNVPIAGAIVFVDRIVRGITDDAGATVVSVPRGIACDLIVSAPGRVSFTAGGTVTTAGESWSFWLFPQD